jgi:chaperonin cofactor prefoldin
LSTTWVYGEYLRSEETDQEHWRIIDVLDERLEKADKRIRELERETAELRARLKALHARQFKPNRKPGG